MAQARFDARGWYETYTPESLIAMAQCIKRLSDVDILVESPIEPPGPGPVEIDPTEVRMFVERIQKDAVVLSPRMQINLTRLASFGTHNRVLNPLIRENGKSTHFSRIGNGSSAQRHDNT